MGTGLIYRSAALYEVAMLLLYGRFYVERYRALAGLVPTSSSVLDVCCGPATLYHRYLRLKAVSSVGLDINERFIRRLLRCGAGGLVWDVRTDEPLPTADYVVMQASLYHFLPDAVPIVDRMLRAARKQVIIAEPIHNLTTGRSRLLSSLSRLLTDPGSGEQAWRFTETSLRELFSNYAGRVAASFLIAGGREQIYVLNGKMPCS